MGNGWRHLMPDKNNSIHQSAFIHHCANFCSVFKLHKTQKWAHILIIYIFPNPIKFQDFFYHDVFLKMTI